MEDFLVVALSERYAHWNEMADLEGGRRGEWFCVSAKYFGPSYQTNTYMMSWDCDVGTKQGQTPSNLSRTNGNGTIKVSLRRVETVEGKREAVNDGHVHD